MIYIIDPLNEVFRLSLFTVFFGIFFRHDCRTKYINGTY